MVARDARTNKSKTVNPLILETSEDRTLFNIGESETSRFFALYEMN